jgi:hypothetical protein
MNTLARDLLGALIAGLIVIAATLAVGMALYSVGFFPEPSCWDCRAP